MYQARQSLTMTPPYHTHNNNNTQQHTTTGHALGRGLTGMMALAGRNQGSPTFYVGNVVSFALPSYALSCSTALLQRAPRMGSLRLAIIPLRVLC